MSTKTKIVVLHMKELIYTLIFVGLGIVLVILLLFMFRPSEKNGEAVETTKYTAGIYTSTIMMGENEVDVQISVNENEICAVSLVNLSEAVTAMYPLMEPALESIRSQIIEKQTTEGITYNIDNQYTSLVLLNAIENALSKAAALPGEAAD